jgi:hypothetical protein
MIAATLLGPAVMDLDTGFGAGMAAAAIVALGAMWLLCGTVLAWTVMQGRAALAPWIGLAAGAALYAVNLYGLAAAYPWLAELRSADTLAAHLVFGLVAAQGYADQTRAPDC